MAHRHGCLNLQITVFSLARGGGYLHLDYTHITCQHNISIITGSLDISIEQFLKISLKSI